MSVDVEERHFLVIFVGGSQAGLSMNWQLTQASIAHVVLERNAPGHAWRAERWDTFRFVTPNWQCRLSEYDYGGDDPNGFMLRDEIAAYVQGYAASFDAPVRGGVAVIRLRQEDGRFLLETADRPYRADQVVVATGGYPTR